MLEIFSKEFYIGMEVPQDVTPEVEEALNRLVPNAWFIWETPQSKMLEKPRDSHLALDMQWGTVPALPGDLILKDAKGKISIVPKGQARSMRLARTNLNDLIKETA